jgi:hypothetical protein
MTPEPNPVNENDLAAMIAAMDQMTAVMRDTFVPGIVAIEKRIKEQGGSAQLAREFALSYGNRLMDVAKIGTPTNSDPQ